jgi:DNA-binding Xre family transcriptional regulator
MIRFKLGEMMEKKQFAEGRRLTVSEVATATGLNRMTLSKLLNHKGYGTGTDTIDRLCAFFECSVEDLMEYLPDEAESPLARPLDTK